MADNIKVAVRIRPLVPKELSNGFQSVIKKINNTQQIVIKNCDAFTYDYALDENETQEELYNLAIKGLVPKLMTGYNVTILAYGQTGSGKTHTMGTTYSGNNNAEMGVIPRAVLDIFDNIKNLSPDHQFIIKCSFMELYQEQLFDLLSNNSREKSNVEIREDSNKGIVIPGLTEISVTSAEEAIDCLIKGSGGRAVGATAMNQESSRSHAIFTVIIQITENNNRNTSTTSKFHLVDLAGSERLKKTKTTGDRFKEGVKINQGLLALGNVISALGSGQVNSYIGYRDSKLTRLLQDSLGGNSVTLMIACVSPADYNMDETLSTLRYADRARKIKNKPIINQDPNIAEINRLNSIIQKLRLEILNSESGPQLTTTNYNVELMQEKINLLSEKNRNLQQQLQGTLQDVAELEMRIVVSETAHDKLHNKCEEFLELFNEINNNFDKDNCSENNTELLVAKMKNVRNLVHEIDGIIRTNKEEVLNHKLTEATNIQLEETDSLSVVAEDMQQKLDFFTTKQINFNNELKRINRELNLKEEHQQKVVGNLSKLCVYEGVNSEANIKECDIKIQNLETEKTELLEKLKSVKENASAKIAEERRKRLQQLELQINELRKKNLQQSKLLKVREKESQKIVNLSSEIQSMKALKVKLIRQMRAESENFRQWKLNREKELTQLKEKDKKRQNEMVRMESLHVKQKNVLKRKVEEAMAINKKLKDAIDKQKSAQNMRKIKGGKFEQVLTTIDNELEVVMSVIDAQYSLDQLMEDRAITNNRLKALKDFYPDRISDINTCSEDLEMRNAQIEDLQQKIHSTDIETKMKIICDGIQSMPEAKAALKHLFNAISELRREYTAKEHKISDIKTACEAADEKVALLQKKYDMYQKKHLEEKANVEQNYEEKITVLLRELNNIPQKFYADTDITPEISERIKIQQETLDKFDSAREELTYYKIKCAQFEEIMNKASQKNDFKIKNPQIKMLMDEQFVLDSSVEISSVEEDDTNKDPDWQKTPLVYKRKFKRKNNLSSTSSISETSKSYSFENGIKRDSENNIKGDSENGIKRDSENNIKGDSENGIKHDSENGIKRESENSIMDQTVTSRCNCKHPCNTKRCKCRSYSNFCSDKCGCNATCLNKAKIEDKENMSNSEEAVNEENIIYDNMSTPIKKLKVSISTEDDINTPVYPFYMKKRPTFYD